MTGRIGLVCVIAAGLPVVAVAQSSAAAPRTAALRGSATDSLSGSALAGGFVVVRGAGRGAITDSSGAFAIDSIPPGTYTVALMHARLDTLGILVTTPPVTFGTNDTVVIALAIPSDRTIVAAKCAGQATDSTPAAVAGVVTDSDNDLPVGRAAVVVSWTDVIVGSRRLGTAPRRRSAETRDSGTFVVCGLPRETRGYVTARRGGDSTAGLPFDLGARVLHVVGLSLASATDSSGAPRGSATLHGKVSGASAAPLVGARVRIAGASSETITDERGEFTLSGLPSGSQRLVVRRVGYLPVERAVVLSAQRPTRLELSMSEFVPVLDEIRVSARVDDVLERVGFAARRRAGAGRYFTAAQIEAARPLDLTDVLANVNPLRRIFVRGRPVIVGRYRARGYNCVRYFVDGNIWRGGSPVDAMRPEEIGALEVYSSTATPSEFGVLGGSCETVVIWTKPLLGLR